MYGKTRKVSYKSDKVVKTSVEQQIVVEGTHIPLVTPEIWNFANEIASRHKKSCTAAPPHIFSGLLFCSDCGSTIARKSDDFFVCNRYKRFGKAEFGCTPHHISYGLLYAAVLASVQEVTQEVRKDRNALIE